MNHLSLDHVIVYISMAITLIVGLRAGKGIQTIRAYAVADKMFGTAALVFTYLATNLAGASIINVAALIFSDGIIVTLALFGLILTFLIQAFFIAPHAVHFPNCITMGDIMEQLYGRISSVIAGTLGLLSSIFLAGMELIVLGIICDKLLGIDPKWGILIGGFILTLYSAHGGIKSVVTTDILQFLMVVVGIPLIAYMAISQAGGVVELCRQLPKEKWLVMEHPKFHFYLVLFLLWTIFPAGMIDSAIIQRLLMGTTKRQLRNQYLIVALFDPIFQIVVLLIALAGCVLYPTGEGQEIIPRMINDFFPIGCKGIAITGLLAIVMSTVDSHLHVIGLTLVHDIIKPVYAAISGKALASTQEKHFAQSATIFVGLAAIAIGLHTTDMFGLLLNSLETTGPILMFPLLTGIMGLKPEKRAFYVAMLATIVVWGACRIYLPTDYSYLTTLISILANGVTFFSCHCWINNGFKMVERKMERPLSEYKQKRTFFKDLLPKNLGAYLSRQLQQQELPYVLTGALCLLHLMLPHFLWNYILKTHTKCLLVVYTVGALLCVLLMIKDKWSHTLRVTYLPYLFYLTLLFCLPFSSTLMFIMSQGDTSWLANLLLSLTLLILLVDWGMILVIGALGMGLSLLFLPYFGDIDWIWHTPSIYFIFYQVLLAILIGVLFMHKKQKKLAQVTHSKKQLGLTHDLHQVDYLYMLQAQAVQKKQMEIQKEPLGMARKALSMLATKHPTEKDLAEKGIAQLDDFVNYYKASFYQTMEALRLKVSSISLEELLIQINRTLNDADLINRIRIQLVTQQKYITCDVRKIVQLLANNLKDLLLESPPNQLITLSIQDSELCYQIQAIARKEYLRRQLALGFLLTQEVNPMPIEASYMGTTLPGNLEVPKTAAELRNRNQAQLIEAHYGCQEVVDSPAGQRRIYLLPIDLHTIRAAIVDQELMPKETPLETSDSLALEQDFLDQLTQTDSILDLNIAKEAIAMIKYAHQGQMRKSGEPFYTHPLKVATVLLTMTKDPDAILAALLHDVLEDTPMHLDQIAYQYGQKVSYLVQKLTHLDSTGKKTQLTAMESYEQLIESSNEHLIMIKLADRLHNMGTLGVYSTDKQKRIAQETLDFYLPLGKKLEKEGKPVKKILDELKAICNSILQI